VTADAARERDARRVDEAEAAAFRDMCRAAPPDFVQGSGLRCLDAGAATLVVAPGLPTTMFNRAIGLGVFRPAVEADVDSVISEFRSAGSRNFWIHLNPGSSPPQIDAWLTARGFALARRRSWAKVVFDGAQAPDTQTALDVREVGVEHADELAAVLAGAFEMPPVFASWFGTLVGRPGWHAVAGFDGEALVCGGFLYRERDFGWLGIGGTRADSRGRGGQRAAMALRMRIALEHGARWIVTETGEPIAGEANPSLANMYRCGFRHVCSRLNYEPG
jgi:hypothetical protein